MNAPKIVVTVSLLMIVATAQHSTAVRVYCCCTMIDTNTDTGPVRGLHIIHYTYLHPTL